MDNGSSTNIIFMQHTNDLELEKEALTRNGTPFIGFNKKVKQILGGVVLLVYEEGENMPTKFMVIHYTSSCNMIMGCS